MLPFLEMPRQNDNVKMNKIKKSAEYGLRKINFESIIHEFARGKERTIVI